MLAGVGLVRRLAETPAMGAIIEREIRPGLEAQDDAALRAAKLRAAP